MSLALSGYFNSILEDVAPLEFTQTSRTTVEIGVVSGGDGGRSFTYSSHITVVIVYRYGGEI